MEAMLLSRPASEKIPMTIDFPVSGEVLTAPHYALRISAGRDADVRVSIDGGPWHACRWAAGYWWYDWEGYRNGYHLLSAQASIDGRVIALEARHISVRLPGDEPAAVPVVRGRRRHV